MRLKLPESLRGIVALVLVALVLGTPASAQIGRGGVGGSPRNPDFNDVQVDGDLSVDGTLSASGADLTSLNASNVSSGTLPDARLSANVALYDASMAGFSSGVLPDARLSTNVPRLSLANVFTTPTWDGTAGTGPITLSGGIAVLTFDETDAAADNGNWALFASNEALVGRAYTDDGGVADDWLFVARTGAVIDSVTLGGSAFVAAGIDMTPESGSFSASFDTACTTTPSITFDYQRIGAIVSLKAVSFSGMPCTSDSTSFSTTGAPVPASLRPSGAAATSPLWAGDGTNNGTASDMCLVIATDGNVFMSRPTGAGNACNTIGWTGSGSKGATPTSQTFTYMTGNP